MSYQIFIHDEFDPEATAMLQALYSRSAESVENHVHKVLAKGSKKFMESYYVGYGHASIGDCGTTTLFFEKVSILAAKAIQDNPLYSGQETSTRYIDFSSQDLHDPLNSKKSYSILRNWIEFYLKASGPLKQFITERFPRTTNTNPATWEKAINARCFDILRGFLPAGATTQLSWATNLRQAYDKLTLLCYHPLAEVRAIAHTALQKLGHRYPASFSHGNAEVRDYYYATFRQSIHYGNAALSPRDGDYLFVNNIDSHRLESEQKDLLQSRPKGVQLPRFVSEYGRCRFRFLLDFGSFRDLQRHRNGLCRIPLVTDRYGFNQWYINQLPPSLQEEAVQFISSQSQAISELGASPEELQYYFPLGQNVCCELVYDLPQIVYVIELRSSVTVHPTLRHVVHRMYQSICESLPMVKLYADLTPDNFCVRRGNQDIISK
ncbi:Thymidylate synthase complementing protein [Gammaproteobacteria bacterium]